MNEMSVMASYIMTFDDLLTDTAYAFFKYVRSNLDDPHWVRLCRHVECGSWTVESKRQARKLRSRRYHNHKKHVKAWLRLLRRLRNESIIMFTSAWLVVYVEQPKELAELKGLDMASSLSRLHK